MWDKRYRPLRFSEILGQEGSIKVLKSRLHKGTGLETSYLFWGGSGQGKTTLGRILARALLCPSLQDGEPCNECDNCLGILNGSSEAFVEQDAASKGTIDNIRAIVEDLPYRVPGAPKRIYLFDEAHRMSKDAQDVLLKPLEENQMVGMFCTTEPEKIRGPIRGRCEDYGLRKVSRETIATRMKWVLDQEKVPYEDDAVLTVVDFSGGHVRDILNRLEMIAQMGSITVDAVREHLHLGVITLYYEILLALPDSAKAVGLVEQACDRVGADEVATGLAEAAMNSYRLVHGMFTDFALADRKLGERVHQMYGPSIVKLAEYFLASYKPTKIGLVCDVVLYRKAFGIEQGHSMPPLVAVSTPMGSPSPVAPASNSIPSAEVAAVAVPVEASGTNGSPLHSGMRTDGIGPVGSSDPFALTPLDHKVIRDNYPRDDRRKQGVSHVTKVAGKSVELLPPGEWRSDFAAAWTGAHSSKGSNGGA